MNYCWHQACKRPKAVCDLSPRTLAFRFASYSSCTRASSALTNLQHHMHKDYRMSSVVETNDGRTFFCSLTFKSSRKKTNPGMPALHSSTAVSRDEDWEIPKVHLHICVPVHDVAVGRKVAVDIIIHHARVLNLSTIHIRQVRCTHSLIQNRDVIADSQHTPCFAWSSAWVVPTP